MTYIAPYMRRKHAAVLLAISVGLTLGACGGGNAEPGAAATSLQGRVVVVNTPDGLNAPDKKELAMELVSSSENSTLDWKSQYAIIEDIGDERGYTAGLVGFTSATDDMLDLVKAYTVAEPGNILSQYLPALQQVNHSASHAGLDPNFVPDWKNAATDPVFQQAQMNVLNAQYFDPAVILAKQDGLGTLGQFIYYDAIVMHGPGSAKKPHSLQGIRAAALLKALPPARKGDETAYLAAFLDARRALMLTESDHKHNIDRIDTQQRLFLTSGNLNLNTPLSWKVNHDPYQIN
ncbi:chitosanase [Janthinobacterium agaricidamnosum]|uniref:Chitosanase n=1 Tax=Janthinobacterium agaricidamnosum NBRC 102515 = DSM 9628 TaxID=1349767 RepID=W0V1L1_9BURK|nr:chitosanase [Janthinobacterium agaricidamnosum]CDG81766.1 chitosanase [Janthinobacterium agaricidamnosum NBRC 102515 = DSM 9628]